MAASRPTTRLLTSSTTHSGPTNDNPVVNNAPVVPDGSLQVNPAENVIAVVEDSNKTVISALLQKYKPVQQQNFKRPGNERKYQELRAILVPLLSAIDGTATSQAAALETCVHLLVTGLKNVLIADSFKRGWAVVDEANQSPMFDSLDEERVYRKAAKRLDEQQSHKRPFSGSYGTSARFQSYGRSAAPIPSLLGRRFDPPRQVNRGCWSCGSTSHKQIDCPTRSGSSRRF